MIYIEINKWDRLGNWLFQFATARSLSDKVAFYGTVEGWKQKLESSLCLFHGAKLVDNVPNDAIEYKQIGFGYSPISRVEDNGDVLLKGYFQSWRYINEPIVRKQYAIPDDIKQKLISKYGDWLRDPSVTSIHVRRGDYLKVPERHPFVGKKYLLAAISKFPKGTKFIVCSDDIPWCKKIFTGNNFKFSSESTPINDIYLQSLCKHNIISNSSFSWWGAWLNANPNKRVIGPKHWFGIAYWYHKTADILWPEVELISNHLEIRYWGVAFVNCVRRTTYWLYLKCGGHEVYVWLKKIFNR